MHHLRVHGLIYNFYIGKILNTAHKCMHWNMYLQYNKSNLVVLTI